MQFRSLTESIDTSTPGGTLMFNIFGSLAQFERDLIRERTRAGLEAARARGREDGRPAKLDEKQVRDVRVQDGDGGSDRRDDARGTVHRLQVSESWPTNPMMAIGKGFPRHEHTTRRFVENKRRHAILKGALFSRKEIQHDDSSRNYCRKPQHGLANHPHHLGDAKLTRY